MGAAGVLRQKEKLHSPSVGAKVPGWPGDFSSQASGLSMSKIKLLARRSDWLDWLWCLGWGQSALTSGMPGRQTRLLGQGLTLLPEGESQPVTPGES